MPLSREEFIRRLTDSTLLSPEDVRACVETLPNDERPKDGEQLARCLVRRKKLTAFQAEQVYKGRGKGLVLGNYTILEKLGQGGMGMVLKAQHARMKRLVALKVLSPDVTKSAELLARFQREVQAAARLEHGNIVTAYDADEAHGTHFLVMQYVDGKDLSTIVKKHGPLPIDRAVDCVIQAARGLDYAHQQNVIHRDIKPANLLQDRDGNVKILDMGLARIDGDAGTQAELTNTGAVMGTVDYMAPEQAMNTKAADARSDQYSLGVTLWYLLTGRPAYEGDSLMSRLLAHRESPIPSLQAARGDVPGALDEVFQKMVAKQAEDRFPSMSAVIDALQACLAGDVSAPSVSSVRSEDTKLSEFLAGLDRDSSTRKEVVEQTLPAVASPVEVVRTAECEPTISMTSPSSETALTGLPESKPGRPGIAPRRQMPLAAARWLHDRRIQVGGAAGALTLLAVFAFFFLPKNDDRASDGGKPPASAGVTQTNGSTPAVPPASGDFAIRFDGQDDYIEIPVIDFDPKKPFTVEAWFTAEPGDKTDATDTDARTDGIICAGNPKNRTAFSLILDRPNAAWYFSVGDHPMHFATFYWFTRVDKRTDLYGVRHHAALVWDGNKVNIYVDGEQKHSGDAQIDTTKRPDLKAAPSQFERFHIGASVAADGVSLTRFLRGTIDEIRVSSVARYRQQFLPIDRFESDSETLALYHFEEGQGEVLVDSSGHDQHGRIVGGTWESRDKTLAQE